MTCKKSRYCHFYYFLKCEKGLAQSYTQKGIRAHNETKPIILDLFKSIKTTCFKKLTKIRWCVDFL